MGLTGVIYAAIVVAWAAFLVPLALHRHDQAARTRSIERFSSAMRVLSRSGSVSSGRVVVTPPRPSVAGDSADLGASAAGASIVRRKRPSRAALAAAARRRLQVLVVLLVVTVVVAALAVVSVVPWWAVALPVAAVGGFLLLARHQVRRASETYWEKESAGSSAPSNVVRRTAVRVEASHGSARDEDDEPTIILTPEQVAAVAGDLAEARVVAVSLPTSDGGSLWDPLPITLPTYVDMPVVKRTIRTIELGEPGTWSAGHSAVPAQSAGTATAAADTDADDAHVAPRVVNG